MLEAVSQDMVVVFLPGRKYTGAFDELSFKSFHSEFSPGKGHVFKSKVSNETMQVKLLKSFPFYVLSVLDEVVVHSTASKARVHVKLLTVVKH